MAWVEFKNTVRCCNCKSYYHPKVWLGRTVFRCPLCQCEDWTYEKKEQNK